MVSPAVLEPENGSMEMFIKVTLLMVSSKDRAYLNVKMADGHMKENGNKAR
jgi:hypothetical protein